MLRSSTKHYAIKGLMAFLLFWLCSKLGVFSAPAAQIPLAALVGYFAKNAFQTRGYGFWMAWIYSLAVMLPIWIIGDIFWGRVFYWDI